jgi:hypothetical protein
LTIPLPPAASAGCPIGNQKAKVERNGASSLVGFDATIEKLVSTFSSDNKDRDESGTIMWRAMLENQDVKLGLER